MTTIMIYLAGFFVFVAVTMVVPGVKTIITPVWAGVGKGVLVLASWLWGWIIFTVKAVVGAHKEIFKHLVSKEDEIDFRRQLKK